MQITGMLHGARLLRFAGFPTAEVLGPDASEEEIKALLGQAHQEAFEILETNRHVLDALVLELLDKETLDKAEIAAIFEALTMNPARPAWTGSPERVPSTIPPVDIPQEIRDRVSAGASAQEAETRGGGVILTPPGPGGDVHGAPDVHPDTPTPPSPDAP